MRRFSQSQLFWMLKSLTTTGSTAAQIGRQASMTVRGSDPKGLQIGRDGKGKRAGELYSVYAIKG